MKPQAPPVGNTRLMAYGTSIFSEMTQLAMAHNAVNLGQGFPNFDGPVALKSRAAEFLQGSSHHQYARSGGLPELCSAIADHQRRFWQLDYDPLLEVTVTAGATEGICASLIGLCNPGDKVLIFAPFYDSYPACIAMAGAEPVVCPLSDDSFRIDRATLEDCADPKLKVVVLNSPHNPSGRVFSDEELRCLAEFCVEHDLWVITDEVYEHLVYDGKHRPLAQFPGMFERTVCISSLGKSFSFTGWKIGHCCAPAPLSAAIRRAHQFITFCVPPALQATAAEAFRYQDEYFEQLSAMFQHRRDRLATGLEHAGLPSIGAEGGYFLLTDIRQLGFSDDRQFCEALPVQRGVAAIPCSPFYAADAKPTHWVRWAFCKDESELDNAIGRLHDLEALQLA